MIAATSGAAPVSRVCRVLGASRATLYRHRAPPKEFRARGPQPTISDDELAERIRVRLEERERLHGFRGEGHRKVHA